MTHPWLALPPRSASAPRAAAGVPARSRIVAAGVRADRAALAAEVPRRHRGADGLEPAVADGGLDWFDGRGTAPDRRARIERAAAVLGERLERLRRETGFTGAQTVLIGYSQGATLALELARRRPGAMAIVVSYAGQLARPNSARRARQRHRAPDPRRARHLGAGGTPNGRSAGCRRSVPMSRSTSSPRARTRWARRCCAWARPA